MDRAKDPNQALWEKIKDIRIAMFTTVDEDGSLRSRPMYTQQTEFGGELWFFTSDDSEKVREIGEGSQVNLSYAAPEQDRYVSLSGRATVVDDPAKERELWNPAYRAFFPDGLDDPRLVLIRVEADHAEYWDAPGSKVQKLFGFAKAVVQRKTYDAGEHEKLEL